MFVVGSPKAQTQPLSLPIATGIGQKQGCHPRVTALRQRGEAVPKPKTVSL
jgi:hypothetical protein